ncbi:hypothetical protein AF335_03515 [Streptomyces eurocidicus]|uniref:Secreted protein n=1 Tax=Streptomyces eurocidicus TaxID=66423 RepID=A0A2N8P325_STREU|nr:hypothetical protein [Streptomyces eurocidicus]MBB5117592.1 hypothetical protein [Streptomyces eurocidicus]MBF6053431.1 hypothetical protein [Streptomyces eurocidicus]PNE35416.1 hypothetical protein AF335_03515 [Streptomyces eurocidicus]
MGVRARAGRAALTLVTSIALVTGLAGESPAATGTLTYTDAQGVAHQKVNPPDGECAFFGSPAVRVENATGTDAALYRDQNCQDFLITVFKGTALTFSSSKPQSIKFG